jgi:hypothetical protein
MGQGVPAAAGMAAGPPSAGGGSGWVNGREELGFPDFIFLDILFFSYP